jgi:hypothetical protein
MENNTSVFKSELFDQFNNYDIETLDELFVIFQDGKIERWNP